MTSPPVELVQHVAEALDPWEVFVAADGERAVRGRDRTDLAHSALAAIASSSAARAWMLEVLGLEEERLNEERALFDAIVKQNAASRSAAWGLIEQRTKERDDARTEVERQRLRVEDRQVLLDAAHAEIDRLRVEATGGGSDENEDSR